MTKAANHKRRMLKQLLMHDVKLQGSPSSYSLALVRSLCHNVCISFSDKHRAAHVRAPAGPVNADAVALEQLLLPDALRAQLRAQPLSHQPAHILRVQPRIRALLGRGHVRRQHLNVCQIYELRLPAQEVPEGALHAAPSLVEVPAITCRRLSHLSVVPLPTRIAFHDSMHDQGLSS